MFRSFMVTREEYEKLIGKNKELRKQNKILKEKLDNIRELQKSRDSEIQWKLLGGS